MLLQACAAASTCVVLELLALPTGLFYLVVLQSWQFNKITIEGSNVLGVYCGYMSLNCFSPIEKSLNVFVFTFLLQ